MYVSLLYLHEIIKELDFNIICNILLDIDRLKCFIISAVTSFEDSCDLNVLDFVNSFLKYININHSVLIFKCAGFRDKSNVRRLFWLIVNECSGENV